MSSATHRHSEDLPPGITVVIPTLNAESVLEDCLRSIVLQDYPAKRLEVLIVDAGSRDRTLEIALDFARRGKIPFRILENPLKTGEAGKAEGFRAARHEFIAFIDSDNILPHSRWLRVMTAPFDEDPTLVASEPIEFTYRREDGYINRYCAMIGMNDPLCLFLGNYDRKCSITNKWTGVHVQEDRKNGFIVVSLGNGSVPTIGANGFLIRKDTLQSAMVGPYLFDVDVLRSIVHKSGKARVAKVDTGIIHLYSKDYATFARKQRRRVLDYFRHRGRERPCETWGPAMKGRLALFILCCVTVLPLLAQGAMGFRRRQDTSWLFHPLACWTTLLIYAKESLLNLFQPGRTMDRDHWSQ